MSIIAKNKLVQGVGKNDADYKVLPMINGKRVLCLYYSTWVHMLERCYSHAYQTKRPTYRGCTVVPSWHSFMEFKAWMAEQDWQGKHLDKDLLIVGNKTYSSTTCLFIEPALNTLLNNSAASRGIYPQGVNWNRRDRKYHACISKYGKNQYLGYFDTTEEASHAYKLAKSNYIQQIALEQTDSRLCTALLIHAGLLRIKL